MLRTGALAAICLTIFASVPASAATKKPDLKVATTEAPAASAPQVTTTDGPSGTTTYFGTTSAPPAAAAAPPPPPPKPTLIAEVDLAHQRMVVTVNGQQKYVWPISSGVSRYPTPTGAFRPEWTSRMWYSRQYDWAPMPYAVFINGGVAVHGTYHTGALGSPASHGCIRLSTANAKTFYNLVGRHGLQMTRVRVFGRPNWRDQVAVGGSSSHKRTYAAADDNWFGDSWGGDSNSAFAPGFATKKSRKGYVMIDGVPRKVYRRKNGGRTNYNTYGYGYGSGF